ncbi:mediator of RNA polymerase II transcription subunit 22 [Parasteatoda tepidariorum]|uniref:mediator of RNA polymerase II transcription subunit 22 n=1 Tax=Parasteatoda tepidariorum TaxID=114398 RepID=UPI00077F8C5D|nr:mediator of RNA polymerase II transcription subunit 22 [Parasteatoda tepidariorum]XP_042905634.1 mediator of RNA polymerase II transcription subunit 22 [Parasteatoda tepidariorum]XP_042905635.1 mediator of RNA polymerase II transcription subunit 22 [Parasteatoda tepidariorum]
MAQVKNLPQSKEALLKSYNKRLKDDVKSMVDNFTEIVKLARPSHEDDGGNVIRPLATSQDQCEMHVRAANIVRAAESLMKLISDIKQYLILNDFPSVNEAISQKTKMCRAVQDSIDSKLTNLRDDMASELYDLEEEYYSSAFKLKPMFSEDNVLN